MLGFLLFAAGLSVQTVLPPVPGECSIAAVPLTTAAVPEVTWAEIRVWAETVEAEVKDSGARSLYSALRRIAESVGRSSVPVVIKDSPAALWPAVADTSRQWTPARLQKQWARMQNVYVSNVSSTFTYSSSFDSGHDMVTMSAARFWSHATDGVPPYVYYNGGTLHLPRHLARDIDVDALTLRHGHDAFVWIGESGVETSAHYDVELNVYAQIYGRKHFWLAPPEQLHGLHLFSCLSDTRRQAQVSRAARSSPPSTVIPGGAAAG